MPFSQEAINQIAHLARLRENTRDGHSIQDDLNRIVQMVDQIASCNTEGVQPLAHPLEMIQQINQRFRKDIVTEIDEREALLALAPKAEADLFLVPTVIE
jgi:aspartyl-tRNA(Asn)/glutamyl-tRNA(Gln) amidotransferase subunit C